MVSSALPQVPPPPTSRGSDTDTDIYGNGKYKRHGGVLDTLHRWLALHGKVTVAGFIGLSCLVFLMPPAKLILYGHPSRKSNNGIIYENDNSPSNSFKSFSIPVPPCNTSPWKPDENLLGQCPGDLRPNPSASTLSSCATTCCQDPKCISWQFRRDVGCLQGKDIRLGQEKDGPAAWCSDHPPNRWAGQYLKFHKTFHGDKLGMSQEDEGEIRRRACDDETWNPNEQIGQCFGLGDVKAGEPSGSAEACRKACCKDEKCGAWQWTEALGCFYSKGMHGCQGDDGNEVKFEPFEGRRKIVEGRKYTDKRGKPWQQQLVLKT
ncbi:hypothetical protein ACHAXS_004019 [Conticribra weissflogii]